jgi:hypothetical protein
MKKKIAKLFIVILMLNLLLILVSCGGETNTDPDIPEPEEAQVVASIKFAKDIFGKELYESTQTNNQVNSLEDFYVNEDIYVIVEFSFNNINQVKDMVEFKVVLIPGIDTYDAYDFEMGVQEPTKIDTEKQYATVNGLERIIEISGMYFEINPEKEKTNPYTYVFKIRSNQTSENCEFKVLFSPWGEFNKGKNESFVAIHSFILNDNNSEEE